MVNSTPASGVLFLGSGRVEQGRGRGGVEQACARGGIGGGFYRRIILCVRPCSPTQRFSNFCRQTSQYRLEGTHCGASALSLGKTSPSSEKPPSPPRTVLAPPLLQEQDSLGLVCPYLTTSSTERIIEKGSASEGKPLIGFLLA